MAIAIGERQIFAVQTKRTELTVTFRIARYRFI
jgi:hypothetical protein